VQYIPDKQTRKYLIYCHIYFVGDVHKRRLQSGVVQSVQAVVL